MIAALAILLAAGTAGFTPVAMQQGAQAPMNDVWQPADTPKGGVAWRLLESTRETTRRKPDGYVYSKPVFPPAVQALNGKRVKVAGFMMPLENSSRQKHFVLLAYPPGCPFHTHAMPNQFIEVRADTAFPVDVEGVTVVEGILELTGQDESGIFYRMKAARPV